MRKLYLKGVALLIVLLLQGCGSSNELAPVSELKWHPYVKNPKTHKVQRGETLYAIAFRYDTDFRQLARFNHIRAPYSLREGQVLNVQAGHGRTVPIRRFASPKSVKTTPNTHNKLVHSPRNPSRSASGWLWPVGGHVVASFVPEQGKKGINIACKKGEKIKASTGGTVAYAGSGLSGYGNLIIIKHNNEYLTAYGNNSKNLVREGQKVRAGQIIADAGVIDRKYWGVHFEIRKAGTPVNPLHYLQKG